jgi:hypothetical protein
MAESSKTGESLQGDMVEMSLRFSAGKIRSSSRISSENEVFIHLKYMSAVATYNIINKQGFKPLWRVFHLSYSSIENA